MSFWSSAGTLNKSFIIASGAAVLVAVVYFANQGDLFVGSPKPPLNETEAISKDTLVDPAITDPVEPVIAKPAEPAAIAAPEGAKDPGPTENTETAMVSEADNAEEISDETEENLPAEAVIVVPLEPEFELVRVDPDGNVVVAGSAQPLSNVTILMGDVAVGETTAGANGDFVALFSVPPSDSPRILSLKTNSEAGPLVASAQNVIISAFGQATEGRQEDTETVDNKLPIGDGENATLTQVEDKIASAVSEEELQPQATLPSANVENEPVVDEVGGDAPKILLATEEGITVLQPGGSAPEVLKEIALDSISYEPSGDVTLSGRSVGAGFVRIYLDNTPIKTLKIDSDGQWRAPLPDVDTGVYTLRIDEVNAEGVVVSRVETPFKREEPSVLSALGSDSVPEDGIKLTLVTVQPGNTLWGIARNNYGDGVLYVRVFDANKDRIRNPDLIYPGQVFSIPN